ncbi:MAG: helix-turn-helix domain-containing protein [Lachnospiraceae bacterium]|nr:helix-turn-helix domain-containing protein [Lachnospiraceae bacterium]
MIKLQHFNVMVVEDEDLLLKSTARHVEELDMGFRVKAMCHNGAEALALLESQNIHLIITDIQMPVMSGLELTHIAQERYPEIRSIILTGYAEFEYAQEALHNQVFEYLLKPVTEEKLLDSLTRVKLALSKQYELEEDSLISSHNAAQIVDYVSLYFQNHFAQEVDLTSLAQRLGFSSAYLAKIFNKHKGCTPIKYLTDLRIQHAKQLLLNTALPIREVGEKVGYADQFHFSKAFRKAAGVSPSSFRNQAAEHVES